MNFKYTPNTLKKFEQLFEECNYRIRYEKGTFQSGYCIIDNKKVAVINKFLNVEGRINVLVEILPTIDVPFDKLSTEMQKWYRMVTNTPDNAIPNLFDQPIEDL
jgi:hypothetical protein